MSRNRDARLARFHDAGVSGELFDGLGGEIGTLEKRQGLVFGKRGVGGGKFQIICWGRGRSRIGWTRLAEFRCFRGCVS